MQKTSILLLVVTGAILAFFGVIFFFNASPSSVTAEHGDRMMSAEYFCLGLGALFLLTSGVLGFIAGTMGTENGGESRES